MSLTLKAHFSTRFGFSISRALIYSIVLPYSLGPGMLLVLFIAPWQSEGTLSLRFLSCHLYEVASPHASSLHKCGVELVYLCFFPNLKARERLYLPLKTALLRRRCIQISPCLTLGSNLEEKHVTPSPPARPPAPPPPPPKKKPHTATTVNTPRDTSPPRRHPPAVPVCPNLCGQLYKFTHTALELECDAMM